MTLAAGTHLGPYEVVAPLGAGGMGEVYRARDPRLSRDVAIKVLPATQSDPDALRRLEQEARAVASLNHPNILAIHDFGVHDGTQYVVCELLVGRTLREVLGSGTLPIRKAIEYAVQIATGLAAAHEHGVIHRDLKPENLFVTRDGRIKILDFGLAKLLDPAARAHDGVPPQLLETMPGVVLGTAAYMAPEQVRGQRTDQRTDIFTFGVVLFEMLSGRRPFGEASAVETMGAIATKDPAELAVVGTSLPPPLLRIVKRCLEKRPEDRFQSARDLAFALACLVDEAAPATAPERPTSARARWPRALALAGIAAVAASIGAVAALRTGRSSEPAFRRVTFQRGSVRAARFGGDVRTIIYSAEWNGRPSQVFTTRAETRESSTLNLPAGDLVATTSTGEVVLLAGKGANPTSALVDSGTLARAPLMGGAARELIEHVNEADATGDGSTFAIVRTVGSRQRLEFPPGQVLYETAGYISSPRISPRGDLVAFLDHPARSDDRGVVAIVDREGHRRVLTREWIGERGLAWSADGREVWFDAGPGDEPRAIYAAALDGKVRLVYNAPQHLKLEDVSREGSVLLSAENLRADVIAISAGEPQERDLSWLYLQVARALSPDGRLLVFSSLSGFDYGSYIRPTDGSAAVRLGDGFAQDLSADGKWVLTSTFSAPNRLTLLPTGPGEVRTIDLGPVRFDPSSNAQWTPDHQRIILGGMEPGHGVRSYTVPVAGGRPVAVTPEGSIGTLLSPNGALLIGRTPAGPQLFNLRTNQSRALPGVDQDERIVRWDATGSGVYVYKADQLPVRVERLDVSSGARVPVFEFKPSDPSGIVSGVLLTPDARTAVFNVRRQTSDLYLVTGLR